MVQHSIFFLITLEGDTVTFPAQTTDKHNTSKPQHLKVSQQNNKKYPTKKEEENISFRASLRGK